MHDHGRYLWRLGKGRFLVRTRHELFVITPEARLNSADPLRPTSFPSREGMPVAAVVSADKGIVMVETMAPQKKGKIEAAGPGMIVTDPQPVVMVDFYRMRGGDAPGTPLSMAGAGVVRAPAPIMLPMDADGYLWASDPKHGAWPVSFNEFGGHEVKIANVDSSCAPRLQMVSRFEFLAFTCQGTDARTRLKSFGMDGHETWEDTLNGTFGTPELAFAPEAGRFALSRIVSATADLNFGSVIPDGATQELRVYQTESGDLLLKVPTSPVTRFAETFDLSEDGLVAAVVNAGVVQVYKLPPPSAKDVKDLTEAKSFSPPASEAPVKFARLESQGEGDGAASTSAAPDVAAAMTPAAGAGGGMGAGGGSPAGSAASVSAGGSAGSPAGAAGSGGAMAPPGAEVTKASADAGAPAGSSDAITDAEAMAVMARTQPAGKAEPTAKTDSPGTDSSGTDSSGDAETGRRKPPTLLEPGENVEKVKAPSQQPQQPSR
jgi:hypothetical protein